MESGDILMVLPISARDEEYARYVRNSDKYKILDNGIAEGKRLSDDELFRIAADLRVDEIIAPDALFDSANTLFLTNTFLQNVPKGLRVMAVPQGRKISDWMSCYKQFVQDDRIDVIGFSKFAIPASFRERTLSTLIRKNRMAALGYIAEWHNQPQNSTMYKPIHLLGLRDPSELELFRNDKIVRSCDTCLPFLAALSGEPMAKMEDELTQIDYFDALLSNEQVAAARTNVAALRKCYS